METETSDHLKSLHTRAIDALHGYEEGLEEAEGKGMTPLFRSMIDLHRDNSQILAVDLVECGEEAEQDGSFMSTVHRTIMDIRSLFGGLDASVLPGLIDGEKRNLTCYDEALALPNMPARVREHLQTQRTRLERAVADMETMQRRAA